MPTPHGHILVVDDNKFNRLLLTRALAEQGHTSATAENGQEALRLLRAQSFDGVLLDVVMPEMDGYATLAQIKNDNALRHIPVIMVSAVDEMDSALRCIEMGATDYLPKPFNAALLRARISASLAGKRLRDLELEYLEQVGYVAEAAAAVETNAFVSEHLDAVAARDDALGRLARVFQRMAREVHAREQRLKQQLEQLRLDMEARQAAAAETVAVYLPMDRRHALARSEALPHRVQGAALFADISGFTPLTEALARELGLQRGVEELTRHLNRVYTVLVEAVHKHGGSVVNFSGDAITCWFNQDDGERAIACALAMQTAMGPFTALATPAGTAMAIVVKIAVAAGSARRFLVGDPQLQNIEVLAGHTLDHLARGERLARPGEVLAEAAMAAPLGARLTVSAERADEATGECFAVISALAQTERITTAAWPNLPPEAVSAQQARAWLPPPVFEKVRSGKSEFLAELRPAAALFLKFEGLDYDGDDNAGRKLDAFVRWVQSVLLRYDGSLLQLTMGDKGSYLYAAFGAPTAHEDDAVRAVSAALELQTPPPALAGITHIHIGVTYGQMYSGAYGGTAQRTYGVLGDKTNLAARLMQVTTGVLCDEAIYEAARTRFDFESLPPIRVKGKGEPIAVYRPSGPRQHTGHLMDSLSPAQQLALKTASVIGRVFALAVLRAVYPIEADKPELEAHLRELERRGLIARHAEHAEVYLFVEAAIQENAYQRMLFAQRRQLHRAVAEWHERAASEDYAVLAHHWRAADETAKAVFYLEKAGERAKANGALEEAAQYFNESLALEAQAAVLSDQY